MRFSSSRGEAEGGVLVYILVIAILFSGIVGTMQWFKHKKLEHMGYVEEPIEEQ